MILSIMQLGNACLFGIWHNIGYYAIECVPQSANLVILQNWLFGYLQLSIILLLTRVPEVNLVTHGNYVRDVGIDHVENIEWLEKRFIYLKEEMITVESRLERMRQEYTLLKSHLQSLEQLKAKSWLQNRYHGAAYEQNLWLVSLSF